MDSSCNGGPCAMGRTEARLKKVTKANDCRLKKNNRQDWSKCSPKALVQWAPVQWMGLKQVSEAIQWAGLHQDCRKDKSKCSPKAIHVFVDCGKCSSESKCSPEAALLQWAGLKQWQDLSTVRMTEASARVRLGPCAMAGLQQAGLKQVLACGNSPCAMDRTEASRTEAIVRLRKVQLAGLKQDCIKTEASVLRLKQCSPDALESAMGRAEARLHQAGLKQGCNKSGLKQAGLKQVFASGPSAMGRTEASVRLRPKCNIWAGLQQVFCCRADILTVSLV
ncbi:hypothetical protein DPMN_083528 [Dreissena polymorpha]|uniref:Uncharacterized protein n=1 Tax=Dreissena polymorpha TaxID=45954 RepID=A0A9D3Y9H6_DREPO|nr:hypothetical protein DPMN_083528 [Dreissena polymorpha]